MTQPSVLREDPLTEDGSDFLAIDPLVVCPQGMFTKAKDMNASTANLFNILKKGLWKWTEDEDPIDNQPNAREDQNKPNWQETEDCLVLNINTPKVNLNYMHKSIIYHCALVKFFLLACFTTLI